MMLASTVQFSKYGRSRSPRTSQRGKPRSCETEETAP
jgi:hypothetical protein